MGKLLRSTGDFVSGVVAGLTLGYAVALLLAPSEGRQARTRLREGAAGAFKEGADAIRQAPLGILDEVQARIQFAMEEGRRAAAAARAELEASATRARPATTGEKVGADRPSI